MRSEAPFTEGLALHPEIHRIEVASGRKFWITAIEANSIHDDKVMVRQKLMESLNGWYPIRLVNLTDLSGPVVLVQAKQLYVPGYDWRWRHKDSRAHYFMRSKYKSPAVRGYFLPPGEETSCHAHLIHRERIFIIWGKAKIYVNDLPADLSEPVTLGQGDVHMLKSGSEGAILCVVTEGSEDCFTLDDHHRFPKPQLTQAP